SDVVFLLESVPAAPPQKPHVTSVLAYQVEPPPAPADARVENRSIWKERGDATTPAAGALCVTEASEAEEAPAGAPARVADLVARAPVSSGRKVVVQDR